MIGLFCLNNKLFVILCHSHVVLLFEAFTFCSQCTCSQCLNEYKQSTIDLVWVHKENGIMTWLNFTVGRLYNKTIFVDINSNHRRRPENISLYNECLDSIKRRRKWGHQRHATFTRSLVLGSAQSTLNYDYSSQIHCTLRSLWRNALPKRVVIAFLDATRVSYEQVILNVDTLGRYYPEP